jgi:hypothetical protein
MQNFAKQISDLDASELQILFNAIHDYKPEKYKIKNLFSHKEDKSKNIKQKNYRQSFEEFRTYLANNGINQIDWGIMKISKFKQLIKAENAINKKIDKIHPGATKKQLKKNKDYRKEIERLTPKDTQKFEDSISSILSPDNPICKHLEIAGKKSKGKKDSTIKSVKTPDSAKKDRKNKTNYNRNTIQPVLASENPAEHSELTITNKKELKEALNNTTDKIQELKLKIAGLSTDVNIKLEKSAIKMTETLLKRTIEGTEDLIKNALAEGKNDVSNTYSCNKGKSNESSVTVNITLPKKSKKQTSRKKTVKQPQ